MSRDADQTAQPRVPLNRERVLAAALRLADEGGIESLSMRKLARELGVEAMSLYNHVANKRDLVDGITDLALSEIELPVADDWDVAIRQFAISAHEALIRHSWACSLVMSPSSPRIAGNPRLRHMDWLLRRLREAGFSPGLTYSAYHALDSHILGFTMWELGHSAGARTLRGDQDFQAFADAVLRELRAGDYPDLAAHAEQHFAETGDGGTREFEFALDLILDGLRNARARA